MKRFIIGIDIGGTTCKIGLIGTSGILHDKCEILTNLSNNGQHIIEGIWKVVNEQLNRLNIPKEAIIGIGVGAPGFINHQQGIVYESVNIGWENYPLTEELSRLSQLPVVLENDANVAAFGEHWQGAGKGTDHLLMITLGTGIGGGIIADGDILSGASGAAGEIGHLTINPNGVQCNCGRIGCLETMVSSRGIIRQALNKAKQYPGSSLGRLHRENGKITVPDIFYLASVGENLSRKIIDHVVDIIGFTLSQLAIVVNPTCIVIGGGISKAGKPLETGIKKYFQKYALARVRESCQIKLAQLRNDAGMIGAARLMLQHDLSL